MKKLLFVTHDFPPYRTSATYRVANLTRYLSRLGWQPTVLTIEREEGKLEEPEQFEKIPPEVRIERTRYFRLRAWEKGAAKAARTVGGLKTGYAEVRQPLFDRCLRSLGEFVRSCLYFPDFSIGWVPFGVARGIKLLRRERLEVIYTAEPPRAGSVIGLLLKMVFGVPWVFELQDPWYPPRRPLRRRFEHWFLGFMLRRADAVVVMIEGHAEDLQKKFHVPREKLVVIPNGFDEEDFRDVHSTSTEMCPPGYLHLSHFGTVYAGNSGRFFPALAELLKERPDLKERLRVHVVGFPDQAIRRSANEDGLREVVELRDFIPTHAQALQEMCASHCLLLFWGDPDFSRLAVAGKTYVYLRTGRPILAVTCQGGVQERVEKANAGWVVNPNDTDAIKRALVALIDHYQTQKPLPGAKPDRVAQFRWDRLAGDLARVLGKVASHGR